MDLIKTYGPLLGGRDLMQALGYRTPGAFRRGIRTGVVQLNIFEVPGRKGKFAYTSEVESWLKSLDGKNRKDEI